MASESDGQADSVSLSRTERVMEVSADENGDPVLDAKDFRRFSDFIASGHLNSSGSSGIPEDENRLEIAQLMPSCSMVYNNLTYILSCGNARISFQICEN